MNYLLHFFVGVDECVFEEACGFIGRHITHVIDIQFYSISRLQHLFHMDDEPIFFPRWKFDFCDIDLQRWWSVVIPFFQCERKKEKKEKVHVNIEKFPCANYFSIKYFSIIILLLIRFQLSDLNVVR